MKKIITLLISSSLMLTAAALAQQDETQAEATPAKKQHRKAQAAKETPPASEGRPATGANQAAKPEAAKRGPKARAAREQGNTAAQDNATGTTEGAQRKSERNANRKAGTGLNPAGASAAGQKAQTQGEAAATAQTPAEAKAGQSNAQANQPNAGPNTRTARAKKPDRQVIEKVKIQHANFHAQPRPQQVPSVTFNQSYRITGAERWQGQKYEVFRAYHPERHDRGWWHSHYNRIVLIGGGYYYWNGGYWYPAWGYDPGQSYYAYDGPIYTGSEAEPPDRVIANVQAVLQEQGYYKGEVDGLLGPLTREALTAYQSDNGLYTTAAIDEPTLESLGMTG